MWSNSLAAACSGVVVGFSKLDAKDAGLLKNDVNNREGCGMACGMGHGYLAVRTSCTSCSQKKVQGSACADSGTAGTVQSCAYPLEKVIALPLGCSGKGHGQSSLANCDQQTTDMTIMTITALQEEIMEKGRVRRYAALVQYSTRRLSTGQLMFKASLLNQSMEERHLLYDNLVR